MPMQVTVSGSGNGEINGTYTHKGTRDGAPKFIRKVGSKQYEVIRANVKGKSVKKWWISRTDRNGISEDIDYFNVPCSSDLPPRIGWEKRVKGTLPLPKITGAVVNDPKWVKLSGAGDSVINGTYNLIGFRDGVPKYSMKRGNKEWQVIRATVKGKDVKKWWVSRTDRNGISSDIDYCNVQCPRYARYPPMDGWQTLRAGTSPVPRFQLENTSADDEKTAASVTNEYRPVAHANQPVFLSYCWAQQDKVMKLHKALEAAGVHAWMDIGNMGGGSSYLRAIEKGMRSAKIVVSCFSPDYIGSENCTDEVYMAKDLKKQRIPILLEHVEWPPEGMAFCFSGKLYIDFKGWNGAGGDRCLQDLVRAIKQQL